MSRSFKVACVQNCAEREMAPSIAALLPLIRKAADGGANLVLLSEMATMVEPDKAALLRKALPESEDPGLAAFRAAAREHGVWLLVGSLLVKERDASRVSNRSLLLDDRGEIVARYDKIHMFDVDLPNGEVYRESATVQPGEHAVVADTPWGRIGLSICYDLRFAYLYRALAQAGAQFLAAPAAFTYTTGKAHWHLLARTRAIETGCFVFAPSQSGTYANGHSSYGHSLVVGPWGEVLADAGEGVGIAMAEIDPAKVEEARAMVPALRHDRSFAKPVIAESRRAAE